jgi:hypothetical protein
MVSRLAYSSTLRMESIYISETFVDFQRIRGIISLKICRTLYKCIVTTRLVAQTEGNEGKWARQILTGAFCLSSTDVTRSAWISNMIDCKDKQKEHNRNTLYIVRKLCEIIM